MLVSIIFAITHASFGVCVALAKNYNYVDQSSLHQVAPINKRQITHMPPIIGKLTINKNNRGPESEDNKFIKVNGKLISINK